MKNDIKYMLLFFSFATGCWVPFVLADLPWPTSHINATQKQTRERAKIDWLVEQKTAHDSLLHSITCDLNELYQRVDTLKGNTEPDEPLPPEEQQTPEQPYEVTLYTADKTWSCGACDKQKKYLKTEKPGFEFSVVECPANGRAPGNRYPCWELTKPNRSTVTRAAAMTAEALNHWVDRNL